MIIRAPASSANLGPGFDCLGLALKLYDEIDFNKGDKLSISGCPEEFRGGDNLAYRGFLSALSAAGRGPEAVQIRFLRQDIPVSRGLGSSAALTAAGALAANELYSLGLTRQELVTAAAMVEGHPDNVAPALLGGLTASAMVDGRAVTASWRLSERLKFTVLVPDFELSTQLARAALPKLAPLSDAVFNISRTALLLKALETGDVALLSAGLDDRLHQPYRRPLIPGCDEARRLALELGAAGFCISGAGSALLCIAADEEFSGRMAAAMAERIPGWRALPLEPDLHGAAALA